MAVDFPELTTIGAVFVFARRLEETGADLLGRLAAAESGDRAEAIERAAKKHARRATDVENARKEKMNETVLEPLTGMDKTPYVPSLEGAGEGADLAALRAAALDLEEKSAHYYADVAEKAGPMIGEMRRIFQRMAKDNGKYGAAVRG